MTSRVLVVGAVVEARVEDGWFAPGQIAGMFESLRLPRPGNVSQALALLQRGGNVVRRRSGGAWSLTPEGRVAVRDLVGGLNIAEVEAEIASVGSAELQHTQQPLIPPELAPVRWAAGIRHLLDEFQFESNVFCMTRFPREEPESELPDPVKNVVTVARETLAARGLHLHLASDRVADDELFGNVAAHMWACKYGIGLFETRFGEDFNDNLQIEVGAMLMTGRRVALLKDRETPDMPTDFVGHIYRPVDFDDPDAVAAVLNAWIQDDLRL